MEIRQLKEIISNLDDDMLVVLACDSEGNEFRPVETFNEDEYTFDHIDYTIVKVEDGDKPCLVLWPW